MARLRRTHNAVTFRCPGCDDHHTINTDRWAWNGSLDAPTFTPSLLVRSGHYAPGHKDGEPCWCTYNAKNPGRSPFTCYLCHSFITDGRIQFLGDCTHKLAGQTVDLPEDTSA